MQATCTKLEYSHDWQGRKGTMKQYNVEFSDGTKGEISFVGSPKFSIGEIVNFEVESTSRGNRIKLIREWNGGGGGGGGSKANVACITACSSLKMASEMLKYQKIDLTKLHATMDRFESLMKPYNAQGKDQGICYNVALQTSVEWATLDLIDPAEIPEKAVDLYEHLIRMSNATS